VQIVQHQRADGPVRIEPTAAAQREIQIARPGRRQQRGIEVRRAGGDAPGCGAASATSPFSSMSPRACCRRSWSTSSVRVSPCTASVTCACRLPLAARLKSDCTR